MCGILGAVCPNLSSEEFESSLRLLRHRGPDNIQVKEFERGGNKTYLGHARLSIIDLSVAANQPFVSKSGRFTVIFNGEIYNYQSLKDELHERHQVNFRTNSDTELIVEAFEVWGLDCIE